MSTVFLQVGQCGNQIGQSFWRKVAKDADCNNGNSFVSGDSHYRAVLVDSEPKVIKRIIRGLPFREESIVTGKRGRGTNWALGYHGLKHQGDDHVMENAVEAVRAEVERCDSFSGIVLLHSLSGGTGSGLGSHLCEVLRDEYPMNYLMSCAFAPCASGESPLQHYNSLLTLATLQRNSDCVVLTHNDDILYRVQKKRGNESVSFSSLNETIASQLCGVFLPTDSLRTRSSFSIGMEPWEMLRSVCPMPSLKFVQINHHAKSKLSWETLTSQLTHTVKRFDPEGKPYSSVGNLLVARGDTTGSFQFATQKVESKIKQAYNTVSWNPFPLDMWTASTNTIGPKNAASVTVVANSSSVLEYLKVISHRSKVMYDAGAYLHWYWKHGADKDLFEESFETLHTVSEAYIEAVKGS